MSAQSGLIVSNDPPLFTPVAINALKLSNRIAVAPMTRISATAEGAITDAMVRYYTRFAAGGFGLIITEGTYTDRAFSQGYVNQPGLSDLDQARAWRKVTRAVHGAGGKIIVQLMHAGALAQANRFRGHTVGPSPIRPKGKQITVYRGIGEYPAPREISEAEIIEAIGGFVQAAILAMEVAGFDGVEIHGANGYLLDQFLTDYTNRRQDGWGGTTKNRVRLTIEVIAAIRKVLGSAATLGVRISQAKVNDASHKWAGREQDATAVFRAIAAADVDYIHVTEPEAWRPAFDNIGASLVKLARLNAPATTVIANGSLHDPKQAAAIVEDGADLVALGRGALANPNWPQRVHAQRELLAFDPALLWPYGDIKPVEQERTE